MQIPEDPFIKELLPEFIDSWIDELSNNFPVIFKEKNTQELYRMAHTMKGSCYQFGLNDLGDVGVELMLLIKSEEWDKVETHCNDVLTKLVSYKEYVNKFLEV